MKLLQSLIILIGVVAGFDAANQLNSGTDKRDFKVTKRVPPQDPYLKKRSNQPY